MDIQKDAWLWVVVQNPGGNEMFLGLHDDENNISFIPAFPEKEDAQIGLKKLVHEKGAKYEVQAIQYDMLTRYASGNGFAVFILNARGEVLRKIESFESD